MKKERIKKQFDFIREIDKEKLGTFIAKLRQEKCYTQKELADKLFLSNKAISKWETGVSQT